MIERHDYETPDQLAMALANSVANNLRSAIERRSIASLVVSGGSTPKLFFQTLAQVDDLDWSKIVVSLVDERWVDMSSERSNAAMVKKYLLQGPAEQALFIPLYREGNTPDIELMATINSSLKKQVPAPFDALILGMGADGHTASFFPDATNLQAALSDPGPALPIIAPQNSEQRITLTLPTVLSAKNLYLHIEGDEKAKTLQNAFEGNEFEQMPIRAVLHQTKNPLHIFWSPKSST